jgi:hypothetical protein
MFKSLRRVVANLAHAIEVKRLRADGADPAPRTMRGLTIPRLVHVKSIEHIGKEVIVDPTEVSKDLTAEQLNDRIRFCIETNEASSMFSAPRFVQMAFRDPHAPQM